MHLASLSLLSSGVVECKVGSWRSSFLIDLNYLLGSTTSISVLLLLLYFDFSCPQSFLPELMMLSIEVRTCQNLKPRKKRGRGRMFQKCAFSTRGDSGWCTMCCVIEAASWKFYGCGVLHCWLPPPFCLPFSLILLLSDLAIQPKLP